MNESNIISAESLSEQIWKNLLDVSSKDDEAKEKVKGWLYTMLDQWEILIREEEYQKIVADIRKSIGSRQRF